MKIILPFLITLVMCSCTIFPHNVENNMDSADMSTPAQYNNNFNNGVLFTIPTKGEVQYIVITPNKREYYNNLITKYQKRFFEKKNIILKKDHGITEYIDQYGNSLYKISAESAKYMMIMNQWLRNGVKPDN